jgi:hypothetical protein
VEEVSVGGRPGFWITGSPHQFGYLDRTGAFLVETLRLAGNTLLWDSGGVVYRVEGAPTRGAALRVAASLH